MIEGEGEGEREGESEEDMRICWQHSCDISKDPAQVQVWTRPPSPSIPIHMREL